MAPSPSPPDKPGPALDRSRQGTAEPLHRSTVPADLRASDADRDRVAGVLREALAEGRLTPEEHGERVDAVYAAKTLGALEPLTRDLPVSGSTPASPTPFPAGPSGDRRERGVSFPARSDSPTVVAVFGGSSRRGRWRVTGRNRAVAIFGGIELDLSEAVFDTSDVVLRVTAVFGGIEIRVPEHVTLVGGGAGIFGGFDVTQHQAPDPAAPVVRVRGAAVFGGVSAKLRKLKRKQLR